MKNALISSALVLICFACIGCSDKNDCSDREDKSLREGMQESIPYQDGQLLRFKTNEGDTFRVRVSRTFDVFKPQAPIVCEEYLEIYLKDSNNTYPFVESIQRGLATDSMFQMAVSPRRKNGTGTTVQFYLTRNQELAGFVTPVYQAQMLPSLQLDGITYNDVLQLDFNYLNDPDDIAQFLYNKAFGILQCRTKEGFVVTRVE